MKSCFDLKNITDPRKRSLLTFFAEHLCTKPYSTPPTPLEKQGENRPSPPVRARCWLRVTKHLFKVTHLMESNRVKPRLF